MEFWSKRRRSRRRNNKKRKKKKGGIAPLSKSRDPHLAGERNLS
jgi:hypothetical protein